MQGAVDLPAHPELVDVIFCFAFLHSQVKPVTERGQNKWPIGLQGTRLRAADRQALAAKPQSTLPEEPILQSVSSYSPLA